MNAKRSGSGASGPAGAPSLAATGNRYFFHDCGPTL
jgi:hypothetical protein